MVWSKRDAASFFDTLLCPDTLRTWFGRPTVTVQELMSVGAMTLEEVQQLSDDGTALTPTSAVYPYSRVWPMGYSWSSAVAQDVSLGLLRHAGSAEEQVVCVEEPPPPRAG